MADTRDIILDAAERRMALEGIDGASLRAIARDAEVNVNVITYHFGSKDNLILAVYRRRVHVVRERISLMLDLVDSGAMDSGQTMHQVIQAYVLTFRQLQREQPFYFVFMSRFSSWPNEEAQDMRQDAQRRLHERTMQTLRRILPDIPEDELSARLIFLLSHTYVTVAGMDAYADLVQQAGLEFDEEQFVAHLVRFFEGGFLISSISREDTHEEN